MKIFDEEIIFYIESLLYTPFISVMFKIFIQILRKYKFLYNLLWLHKVTLNKINSTNEKYTEFCNWSYISNDIKFYVELREHNETKIKSLKLI